MTEFPLFSILIANYNNGRFLQEAIDSVFAQTYKNWEIILVDDKSTDNSFDIYEKYKDDSRFHIYYNDNNEGCGYTKRRCAELANGDICGFLDPDDSLLSEALLKHVGVHVKMPNVSIVYSRCYYRNSKGIITGENQLLELDEGETYFDYRWYGAMHLASYKNDFYKKTEGISPIIKAGVDQDLYFKVEEKGDVYVLNEFTYNYFDRNDNAITKDKGRMMYWNMEVRKEACKRRGLNADVIISNDWGRVMKDLEEEAAYRKELEIHSSYAYRIGKFALRPLTWIKRLLK